MSKRNLYEDLGLDAHVDAESGPVALNVENIKKETYRRIQAANMERKVIPMRKKTVKWFYAAAACLLACIVTLNAFPQAAMALNEVPVVGDVVRVVTFGRYEKQTEKLDVQIGAARVEGLSDKELEARLNAEFEAHAQSLIRAFEEDITRAEAEGEDGYRSLLSGYEVCTDNEDILALDLYVYEAMASSDARHKHYTIDKESGELLTLSGLFKPGSDYAARLSAHIEAEMRHANAQEGGMYFVDADEFSEGFTGIDAEQDFYIDAQGNLVICFDKYEVAAGAQGAPSFTIPQDVIADIYVGC